MNEDTGNKTVVLQTGKHAKEKFVSANKTTFSGLKKSAIKAATSDKITKSLERHPYNKTRKK